MREGVSPVHGNHAHLSHGPDLYEAGDLLETGILNYRVSTTTLRHSRCVLRTDDLLVRPENDEDDDLGQLSKYRLYIIYPHVAHTVALPVISSCILADHDHADDHDAQARY